MPKIIVVNGLKCICDETAVESMYYEADGTVLMTKNDWKQLKKELKK